MRVVIIAGTRPEAIKLIPVYFEAKRAGLETLMVSTGQHREMLQQVFDWFEVQPDYDLQLMQQNQSLASLSAAALQQLDQLYKNIRPDVVVVQGDTTTAFIAGLTAFYQQLKIVHVEAGLRTYDKFSPWPEEINRTLLSRLADLHFAPTALSARHLHNEGIAADTVFVTGNTVIDALLFTREKVKQAQLVPPSLHFLFEGDAKSRQMILITGHRRENWGEGFASICRAIRTLAEEFPELYFVYPVHLNPNVRGIVYEALGGVSNIVLTEPVNYPEFVQLMERSFIILTDSGGVQEEAPSLGKPVLVLRNTTERPEGVEAGSVKLVGTGAEQILAAFRTLVQDPSVYQSMTSVRNPYGDGTASHRIIEEIVNRFRL